MWSTTIAEKQKIRSIVSALEAPRVLEIGGFRGETTRVLAEAASHRGGSVVVIDPMRWAAEVVANGLVRHLPHAIAPYLHKLSSWMGKAGYEDAFWESVGPFRPHVRLFRGLSTERRLLDSDEPELQRFDVVFIDGDHSEAGAESDLWNWGRRTVLGGSILVHDATTDFPGVLAALRAFGEASGLPVELPIRDSLAGIHVTRSLATMHGRGFRGGGPPGAPPAHHLTGRSVTGTSVTGTSVTGTSVTGTSITGTSVMGTSASHLHPTTAHEPSRSTARAGGGA